jgi:hypothetical protein
MSHNALRVNNKTSLALADLVQGTPQEDNLIVVTNGALAPGSITQQSEYAVISLGNTSTAAYTPTSGIYGTSASSLRFFLNSTAKAAGPRAALFEGGVTYEGLLFQYFGVGSSLAGWYLCTATLNIGGGVSRVAFQWGIGGPWVYLTASTSDFKMSATLRTVAYLATGLGSRTRINVKTLAGSNFGANTNKTATISIDVTRIG